MYGPYEDNEEPYEEGAFEDHEEWEEGKGEYGW